MQDAKRKWAWLALGAAVLGLVAVALLAVMDARYLARHGWPNVNAETLVGRDFVNLWSAGRLVLGGQTAILYDPAAYGAWQSAAIGHGIAHHNYSYPPLTLIYAPLLGALPYPVALLLFVGGSMALYALAARGWLAREGLAPGWALAVPAAWLCVWAGHYGLLLAALWCAAWSRMERQPRLAGVAIGLMAVKPHLAILAPLLLARRRDWSAFAAAAVTVALLVAASALLFGAGLWKGFLFATSGYQLGLVGKADSMFVLMMPTWAPALVAWGLPLGAALVVQGMIAAVVVALLWWRLPDQPVRVGALGAIATFIVLPYGFNYDLPAVGLASLIVLVDAAGARRWGEAAVAAAVLAMPGWMMVLGAMGVRVAPVALTLLFVLTWRRWALVGGRSRFPGGEAVALGA